MENIRQILSAVRQNGDFCEAYFDVLEEFVSLAVSPGCDLEKKYAVIIISDLKSMNYRTNKVQAHENLIGEFSNQFSLFCLQNRAFSQFQHMTLLFPLEFGLWLYHSLEKRDH